MLERRLQCPNCGVRQDEWDPKLGGDHDAYYAEGHRCHTCEQVGWEADAYRSSGVDVKGVTIQLKRTQKVPVHPLMLAGVPIGV